MTRAYAFREDVEEVARTFARDTKDHKMTVLQDQGVYRHIRYGVPGSSFYAFWITTFPGHLVVTGDMGTWAFARLTDMFEFFRSPDGRINTSYWRQKLEASKYVPTFIDERLVRSAIWGEALRACRRMTEAGFDRESRQAMLDEFKHLRARCNDEMADASRHMATFEIEMMGSVKATNGKAHQRFRHQIEGADLPTIHTYTHEYLWICHAIVWGIQQYDAAQAPAAAQLTEVPA